MAKQFLKIIKSLFLLFIIFELIFFIYFSFSNLKQQISDYKIRKLSAQSYKYFSQFELILPKPNSNIIHITDEFTDNFKTKDVLDLGVGFFDDGINQNKKVYSVAIGDSFTRGIGSLDNLKYGWVELIEKRLKWIDILNLAHLGGGALHQRYSYNKIKSSIDHNLVLFNFSTTLGFIENLDDRFPTHYMRSIMVHENLNESQLQERIDNLNNAHGYKVYLEYFTNNHFYHSYTVGFVFKFISLLEIKNLIPKKFQTHYITGKNQDVHNFNKGKYRMGLLNEEHADMRTRLEQSRSTKVLNDRNFSEFTAYADKVFLDKIINHSAKIINEFSEEVKLDGRDFIMTILPSKNDVYYPIYKGTLSNENKIDYEEIRNKLKLKLKKDIKIIDITEDLTKFVIKNPQEEIYWFNDNHFNKLGYKLVSDFISKKLNKIYDFGN
ncbi:MAG: hypothetical protein CBE07_001615 [Pelagibacteraceae bacterium TMED247]|nr:hypothetical protein [Candidatus Pelagibacter sp.]RPG05527.1 MAG: hypothetical protein CBE07_001615 [Pelagibacteraceae bacterium TMED247]|tara:strand:- start:1884 stop:3194 length:1311 start_codon:yes stop_codon:yes gene_type:complete